MKKDDDVYISDIIECCRIILDHLNGVCENEFERNILIQDAVIRRFEIIGEAASKISDKFKAMHQDVEWQLIKDMRNKLIHEYFGVSAITIYETALTDIPPLIEKLEKFKI